MGQNVNASQGQSVFQVYARPDEQNNIIKRQGQFMRVLKAQVCPCNQNGQPDIFHKLCNGKGFLYSSQKEIDVDEENSPHARVRPNVVQPFNQPITKVKYVKAKSKPELSNSLSYDSLKILSFTEKEIYLDPAQRLPNENQDITVGYKYLYWDRKKLTIKGNGTYILSLKEQLLIRDVTQIPNFFQFYDDIVFINSCNQPVERFYKQFVILDEAKLQTPPSANDTITIDIMVARPHIIAVTNLDEQQLRNDLVLSEMTSGDAMLVVPAYVDLGEGDRVTMLSTVLRRSETRLKSGDDREELTEFDISEIVGFAIDKEGNKYLPNVDFVLDDFNYIKWISNNRPIQGEAYSLNYEYFPTYIVFKPVMPKYIGHENRKWPKTFLAKKYQKIILKQEADIFTEQNVLPDNAENTTETNRRKPSFDNL